MREAILYAPEWYWKLPEEERAKGRCGPGDGLMEKLVPDDNWFQPIRDCCQIHDKQYSPEFNPEIQAAMKLAEPERSFQLEEIKKSADTTLLNNLIRKADTTPLWLLRRLRRRGALEYYSEVRDFGGPSFWKNINKPEEWGGENGERIL